MTATSPSTASSGALAEVEDIVRALVMEGKEEFYASYVTQMLGISGDQAHERLAELDRQGVVSVRFDVICPQTTKALRTYKLGDKIPIGEQILDEEGEYFELSEGDIIVSYSPTTEFAQRTKRERRNAGGSQEGADRPDSKLYEAWWALRYHLSVVFVGTPAHFIVGVKYGLSAFRREFRRTWNDRWRMSERKEAYRRFTNVR